MVHCRSSIEITLSPRESAPWDWASGYLFWAVECWEYSLSHLLFSVSCRSAPLPSLLNAFSYALFSWSVSGRIVLVRPLVSMEAGVWECVASVLKLTPIRWVPIAIGFLPIHWVPTALRFSLVRCFPIALKLIVVCCDVATRCPLLVSFLFVLENVKPCKEYPGWRQAGRSHVRISTPMSCWLALSLLWVSRILEVQVL